MKYFGYFDAGDWLFFKVWIRRWWPLGLGGLTFFSQPVYANLSGTLAATIFISGNPSGTDNVAINFPYGSSGDMSANRKLSTADGRLSSK